jgi:LL-H family phage holin
MDGILPLVAPILVNVLLALLTTVLTAVGSYAAMWIKSKLNASQLGLLEDIAANVVLAVEQSTYGTELANNAAAKKSQAIALMNSFLEKYSITLTEAQIDAAIEAAVANVLNANKLIEPPKMVEISSTESGFINGG